VFLVVICPQCGKPVRYISAARGGDIFMVETEPETLIGETGRILTGYREHNCPENKEEKADGEHHHRK
jgi:ssDNA-binding Zn-finger/Zn-ribbon topoisomerase 1